MRKIRRGNRLTKNQRKCQDELKKEIENVKKTARIVSRGIPHKQVKIATRTNKEIVSAAWIQR